MVPKFSSTALGRLYVLIVYHEVYCPHGISYIDGYYYLNYYEVSRRSRGRVSRVRLDIEALLRSGILFDYEDVSKGVCRFRVRPPADFSRHKGVMPQEPRYGKTN